MINCWYLRVSLSGRSDAATLRVPVVRHKAGTYAKPPLRPLPGRLQLSTMVAMKSVGWHSTG